MRERWRMNWLGCSMGSREPSKRRTRTRLLPSRWGSLALFESRMLPAPKRRRSPGISASKRSLSAAARCSRVSKATGKWRRSMSARACGLAEERLRRRRPPPLLLLQPLVEVELHGLARNVEVDLREHVVAGHHQGLQRVDAPFLDADPPFARLRVLGGENGVEQPLQVVGAVAHAAEQAVAQQVVHLVHVELAGDDLRQQPFGGRAAAGEQAGDVRGADPLAVSAEDLLDLLGAQQAAGHLLVVDAALEEILRRVAEGRVAKVVKQGGGAGDPPLGAMGPGGQQVLALRGALGTDF